MRRIDEWMPIFISRYLADTVHLNNAMSGSYLHALMYEWVNGPLPDNMEQCARIMKIEGLGAPDLAAALLKNFFEKVSDAGGNPCWIQKRAEKIKADLIEKAVKYSERSKNANSIRWHGHVAKRPTRTKTAEMSVLQGLPQASLQAQRQALPQGLPVVQVLEVQSQNGDSLRSSPEGQPQAAGLLVGAETHVRNGSKPNGQVKGSPSHPKTPQDAPESVRTASSVTRDEKIAPTRQGLRKTGVENGSEITGKPKRVPDPRFVPFRREVLLYWKHQNPGGLRYGWNEEDGRALNNLLRKFRGLGLAHMKTLLRNRANSEAINPAEAPARWIGQLGEYSAGPLDRFRRPK